MKIGIFGGTFNPIHIGHINIAKAAISVFGLDRVILLPAGIPPHKASADIACRTDRISMCQLAVEDLEGIEVSRLEIDSLEPNYSYKTVTYLKNQYPLDQLYFIIGEDSLQNFKNWVKPEIIAEKTSLLVAIRSDNKDQLFAEIDELNQVFPGRINYLDLNFTAVSSSAIRTLISNGSDATLKAVPAKVAEYIEEHHLYKNSMDIKEINKIRTKVEKVLKPSRYQHTLGVSYTAANLAMHYSYSMNDALAAGLLHDCAKYLGSDELLKECRKNGIEITEAELRSPHLLHAKVGEFFAEAVYGVTDKNILHAIRVHTTGCPNMNLLDKIIFVADYIEPNRNKAKHLDDIRDLAYQDLDLTVAVILRDTIDYLKETDACMDEETLITYEYYRNEILKRGQDVSLMEF